MTDSTQSGSDNDVTSKHPSTEVGTSKIKDTQAEQSAKIAHTTQAEHMNNSSQSTPYAQGSAQAELDDILEDFYDGDIRQSDIGKAKYAIIAWHNKQAEEVLDRLSAEVKRAHDKEGDFLEMAVDIIEAERNKLKGD